MSLVLIGFDAPRIPFNESPPDGFVAIKHDGSGLALARCDWFCTAKENLIPMKDAA